MVLVSGVAGALAYLYLRATGEEIITESFQDFFSRNFLIQNRHFFDFGNANNQK